MFQLSQVGHVTGPWSFSDIKKKEIAVSMRITLLQKTLKKLTWSKDISKKG